MITEIISTRHSTALRHAIDILNNGGLVAFPTDTVYGLAAPAHKPESIDGLYSAKGRQSGKAISILVSEKADLDRIILKMNKLIERLADAFWPGPLTMIVKKHAAIPENLSPNQTIGIRIPDHPLALDLLQIAGPLAVSSANMSGQDSTTEPEEVLRQLQGRIHLLLDGGKTPGGIPSTVVDCTSSRPKILRKGPISDSDLLKALLSEK
jgi:L-threonylcarbamoyladenylate synthase